MSYGLLDGPPAALAGTTAMPRSQLRHPTRAPTGAHGGVVDPLPISL